jgi:PIN like domain
VKKIKEIIDQGASEHPDLMTSDHIRETITELFNGKVGKKFDEKKLANIYQEGAKRYEQKVPPGYKDAEKGGTRQFGDLVVWMEILEHAKDKKHPVIFITSDTKEDWWWKHGQFTVGPRSEPIQEIAAFSNVKFLHV